MKKLFLCLILITTVIITATACHDNEDTSAVKPSESTSFTSTTSVTETSQTKSDEIAPAITENRTITFSPLSTTEGDGWFWENNFDKYNLWMKWANEDGFSAAICLITLNEIEPTADTDWMDTPVRFTIDKIYQCSANFEFQVYDAVDALDYAEWIDEGDGNYTVRHPSYIMPLTEIGEQYIVCFMQFVSKDGPVALYDKYEYAVEALTIPINENIANEEYIEGWFDSMGVDSVAVATFNSAMEKLYLNSTSQ